MDNEEKVKKVFDLLLNGLTLTHACRACDIKPAQYMKTIFSSPHLTDLYRQLDILRSELSIERAEEIAETEEDVSKAKMKIDLIKWAAAKRNPEKFGDNVNIKIEKSISIRDALEEARARAIPIPALNVNSLPDQRIIINTNDQPIETTAAPCVTPSLDELLE